MRIETIAPASVVPSRQFPSSGPPEAQLGAADGLERRPVRLAAADNPGLVLTPPAPAAAAAAGPRFPRNLCYRGDCGVEMERIWNAFQAAGPVDQGRIPRVFSGNMYWLSSMYNASHAHHGGLLLDREPDGALTFNGRWSFFAPTNPYAGTTIDEARASWGTHYAVQTRPDHLYVDCTPPNDPRALPLEYWMREDPTTHALYVIGFFGNGQFAVGELKAND